VKAIFRTLSAVIVVAVIFSMTSLSGAMAQGTHPGGEGKIIGAWPHNCFQTRSASVTEVCGDYVIRWKIWTLMGEPVGDYNLSWTLKSLKIQNSESKQTFDYSADQLPPALKADSDRIELFISAWTEVTTSGVNGVVGYHQFDTGVSVRSGNRTSMNVPGSPSWNRMFASSVNAVSGACDANPSRYLDDAAAKSAVAKGITLGPSLVFCRNTSVGELSSIEGRIAELCAIPESNKLYPFCPPLKPEKNRKTSTSIVADGFAKLDALNGKSASATVGKAVSGGGSPIELAFAQMEAGTKAQNLKIAKERAEREQREAIVATCKAAISEQNTCLAQSCGTEPESQMCIRQERDEVEPGHCPEGESCLIFPKFHCAAFGENPAFDKWRQCTAKLDKSLCTPSGHVQTLDSCVMSTNERLSSDSNATKTRVKTLK